MVLKKLKNNLKKTRISGWDMAAQGPGFGPGFDNVFSIFSKRDFSKVGGIRA